MIDRSIKNNGETYEMLYTSYYGPAEGRTGDDLSQVVGPATDMEI
ncbi:hypothetical protein M6B38_351995 [Iris pallida]|uniref:Uncharacterized protein n=1 Tax=Iris pallida TaxID=29817 RepID=A0AAX6GPQ0_IRIPA|nr:hypothetical protein M6B38_362465 [Iris pallida]KAJ6830746.1 hypothetical protein M6B38_351995 [Iris pallida]